MDEAEREEPSKASDGETRLSPARPCAMTLERRRVGVQDGPGVVVGAGIVRVGILGDHGKLAHIVGPIAQRGEFERAPHRGRPRRRLDPGEGVAKSHTPPASHLDLHLTGQPPET